jgi:hypothetical protein
VHLEAADIDGVVEFVAEMPVEGHVPVSVGVKRDSLGFGMGVGFLVHPFHDSAATALALELGRHCQAEQVEVPRAWSDGAHTPVPTVKPGYRTRASYERKLDQSAE